MPIYEYECKGCGERHEFIQKFSEGPKRKCPSCGKSRLRKLISAAAFHLKGDGWYVTDFRDKNKKKDKAEAGAAGDASSEAKAGGNGGSKTDGKSETKGETRSEPKSETKSEPKSKPKGDKGAAAGT